MKVAGSRRSGMAKVSDDDDVGGTRRSGRSLLTPIRTSAPSLHPPWKPDRMGEGQGNHDK